MAARGLGDNPEQIAPGRDCKMENVRGPGDGIDIISGRCQGFEKGRRTKGLEGAVREACGKGETWADDEVR